MRLSIITPTIGRETLRRSAESVLPQLDAEDEWIVVGDGPQEFARDLVSDIDDPRVRYRQTLGTRCWGNAERDLGAASAVGDRLVFLDDDDELTEDALDAIRRTAQTSRPLIFRMQIEPWHGTLLWEQPLLMSGNVGTPMFVPVRNDKLPLWQEGAALGYGSDFSFIQRCCMAQGDPIFRPEVICVVHHARDPMPPRFKQGRGPVQAVGRGVRIIR